MINSYKKYNSLLQNSVCLLFAAFMYFFTLCTHEF